MTRYVVTRSSVKPGTDFDRAMAHVNLGASADRPGAISLVLRGIARELSFLKEYEDNPNPRTPAAQELKKRAAKLHKAYQDIATRKRMVQPYDTNVIVDGIRFGYRKVEN